MDNSMTCDKCFLIDCCCEADRLQVIKDDEEAMKKGYFPVDVKKNGDIRWVKTSKRVMKYICNEKGELIGEGIHVPPFQVYMTTEEIEHTNLMNREQPLLSEVDDNLEINKLASIEDSNVECKKKSKTVDKCSYKKDTEEYYKFWEDRGYEFVEGRTIHKTGKDKGFTKSI